MEICVLHSKYKVFWGSKGAKKGVPSTFLGAILGSFSIKNLIKNRCKNRCRKSDEIWCQNGQKWCQHGSKNHDFLSLFAKRWLYESVSFTGEIQGFLRYRPSKIRNNSSKNHKKIIKDSCSKKWCKKDGKVVQNGAKMGSQIAQKSIQKSIKKSMWKSMPFKEISKMVKSPKLPTIQQDYLQVVYLNIT